MRIAGVMVGPVLVQEVYHTSEGFAAAGRGDPWGEAARRIRYNILHARPRVPVLHQPGLPGIG